MACTLDDSSNGDRLITLLIDGDIAHTIYADD